MEQQICSSSCDIEQVYPLSIQKLQDTNLESSVFVKILTAEFDPTGTSKINSLLKSKIFKTEGSSLSHLKRIRKGKAGVEIIISTYDNIHSNIDLFDTTFGEITQFILNHEGTKLREAENWEEIQSKKPTEVLFEYGNILQVPRFSVSVRSIYEKLIQIWPMQYKQDKFSDINHSKKEIADLQRICGSIIEKYNEQEEVESLDPCMNNYAALYDPKSGRVSCETGRGEEWSPINHSIMNLFKINGENILEQKKAQKGSTEEEILTHCGEKRKREEEEEKIPHCKSINEHKLTYDPDAQYFAQNLWLICYREPCIMCSMACEHSRISRVYYTCPLSNPYLHKNSATGGLGSLDCRQESLDYEEENQRINKDKEGVEIQLVRNFFSVFQVKLDLTQEQ
ncbi:unnamed protein product [Moneuplotes crassus]|uniref:Uncharacterized protein n=1 Tax=Euplotes crassus TaxID=5936 RepID=A0AAD1UH94_EUPCR|nr:unnamed protein product [Moneuplotes crassus]